MPPLHLASGLTLTPMPLPQPTNRSIEGPDQPSFRVVAGG